jgi:hypothetical protein
MREPSDGNGKMSDTSTNLRDGSEWIDHEDCIVGDEAGLRSLIRACEVALSEGEYFGSDLGEWVGVKRLDSQWFRSPKDGPATRLANGCLATALIGFLAFAIIGVITVATLLFRVAA